jgi:hypothetical protein
VKVRGQQGLTRRDWRLWAVLLRFRVQFNLACGIGEGRPNGSQAPGGLCVARARNKCRCSNLPVVHLANSVPWV